MGIVYILGLSANCEPTLVAQGPPLLPKHQHTYRVLSDSDEISIFPYTQLLITSHTMLLSLLALLPLITASVSGFDPTNDRNIC